MKTKLLAAFAVLLMMFTMPAYAVTGVTACKAKMAADKTIPRYISCECVGARLRNRELVSILHASAKGEKAAYPLVKKYAARRGQEWTTRGKNAKATIRLAFVACAS